MTREDSTVWCAEAWEAFAMARTRAAGPLSNPTDSALFADGLLCEFQERFKFTITDAPVKPEDQP